MAILEIQHLLPQYIEAMFPRWMGMDLGLYFGLDMGFTNPDDYENDIRMMRHVLIHRPMNYTKVLVSPKTGFTEFQTTQFTMGTRSEYFNKYSDHDSCWRSDGFRWMSDDYFSAAKKFDIIPKDMHCHITFGLCSDPNFVLIDKLEPIRQDDGYVRGYNVKLKGKVKLRDVHKYMPEE